MLKRVVCFLVLLVLFGGQVYSETLVPSVDESIVWVKGMEYQLTEGQQEDVLERVNAVIDNESKSIVGAINAKSRLKQLHLLVEESSLRVNKKSAVQLVEKYSKLLQLCYEDGKMTASDIQSMTDQFIDLLGKKITKIEGINQSQLKQSLKDVVSANAYAQGKFIINGPKVIRVEDLKELTITIEKVHRVTSYNLNEYNSFKDLGKNLSKVLVLEVSSDDMNVTLISDVVKDLSQRQIAIDINHMGIIYEIPKNHLQEHMGDFKMEIKAVTTDEVNNYNKQLVNASVEPILARSIKFGNTIKKEMIKVRLPLSKLKMMMADEGYYGICTTKENNWRLEITNYEFGNLITNIPSTSVFSGVKFKPQFSDLINHWAEKSISTLLAQGIVSNDNSALFRPNDIMTRGEFVETLIHIVGTENVSENIFIDIPKGSEYEDMIGSAIFYGFTVGKVDNKFYPNEALTREDMVTLAEKMFKVKNGYKLEGGLLRFRDMNDISDYAKDAVMVMKEASYISGYDDNTFRPKNTVTRSEAIAVIYKILYK